MAVKKLTPITPGTRHRVVVDTSHLSKKAPEKALLGSKSSSGGRNDAGELTMRYRGGGHKRRYRVVDFKRDNHGVAGVVNALEYDPNRSAFIALVFYKNGDKRYILAPDGLKVGATIISGPGVTPDLGNCLPLSEIPLGSDIHNIELRPGTGGSIARSAGASAVLANKDGKYAIVKMPSGELRMILLTCVATIGKVSNPDHSLEKLGKAGRKRWLGRRPRTRGVAMNPVDHPMGGGEGRSSGGHPRSRNGQISKGFKTRKPKKASSKFIISRRKK